MEEWRGWGIFVLFVSFLFSSVAVLAVDRLIGNGRLTGELIGVAAADDHQVSR